MIIEVGKYYRTRGGYIAQLYSDHPAQTYPFRGAYRYYCIDHQNYIWQEASWTDNGQYDINVKLHMLDLIAGPFDSKEEVLAYDWKA